MTRRVRTFSNNRDLVDLRRREIVDVASHLFVKKGYDRTSMRDLSKALNMSPGGIYNYIGSKDDILYLILAFDVENQKKRLQKMHEEISSIAPAKAVRRAIQINLKDVDEFQDMYIFVNHVTVNLDQEYRKLLFDSSERLVNFYKDLLQKGVEAGEFQIDDPQLYAFDIVSLIYMWANRRWYLQKRYTLEEYTKKQTNIILDNLRQDIS